MFGLGSSMVHPWFSHVSAMFQPWFVMLILYFFFWRQPSSNNPDLMEKRENPESNLSQT